MAERIQPSRMCTIPWLKRIGTACFDCRRACCGRVVGRVVDAIAGAANAVTNAAAPSGTRNRETAGNGRSVS